jgi:recombination protein RecT
MIKDLTIKKKQGNEWVEYPALDVCTKQSIANSLVDMAVQGLNPLKKQCYFVPFKDKLTLMRSYQGTMAAAKRAGVKKTPIAQIIYEGDTFEYHIENGLYVIDKHVQDFMNIDNTKIKGAYAIVETEDGPYVEIMNIGQIRKSWAKGKGYDPTKVDSVHAEFTDQMCKKTVINRVCKNIINSSDDGNLTEAFDNTSENENLDIVAGEVQHDIEVNANSEEFIAPPAPIEKVQGEVVEEPQKQEPPKQKTKLTQNKAPDKPDWMPQEG